MVLKNAVRDLGVQRIITSPLEHHAVLHTLESLKKTTDIVVEMVEIDDKGHVSLENLENILRGGNYLINCFISPFDIYIRCAIPLFAPMKTAFFGLRNQIGIYKKKRCDDFDT